MTTADHVSDDGSPLALYLALPAGDGPAIIDRSIGPASTLLELGSGPGRLTRVLVAFGHRVTAVDDSDEMLAHVTGAATVRADLWALDLGERFDAVLAASHLVNRPGRETRHDLLEVGRRHLDVGGRMILERHAPGWLHTVAGGTSTAGPVEIELEIGEMRGSVRSASAVYRLGDRSWQQRFDAEDVDDATLRDDATATGFGPPIELDESGRWVALDAV